MTAGVECRRFHVPYHLEVKLRTRASHRPLPSARRLGHPSYAMSGECTLQVGERFPAHVIPSTDLTALPYTDRAHPFSRQDVDGVAPVFKPRPSQSAEAPCWDRLVLHLQIADITTSSTYPADRRSKESVSWLVSSGRESEAPWVAVES